MRIGKKSSLLWRTIQYKRCGKRKTGNRSEHRSKVVSFAIGAVRGWVSQLSPAQVRLIEEHAGSTLLRLGYPLSSQLSAKKRHRIR